MSYTYKSTIGLYGHKVIYMLANMCLQLKIDRQHMPQLPYNKKYKHFYIMALWALLFSMLKNLKCFTRRLQGLYHNKILTMRLMAKI